MNRSSTKATGAETSPIRNNSAIWAGVPSRIVSTGTVPIGGAPAAASSSSLTLGSSGILRRLSHCLIVAPVGAHSAVVRGARCDGHVVGIDLDFLPDAVLVVWHVLQPVVEGGPVRERDDGHGADHTALLVEDGSSDEHVARLDGATGGGQMPLADHHAARERLVVGAVVGDDKELHHAPPVASRGDSPSGAGRSRSRFV